MASNIKFKNIKLKPMKLIFPWVGEEMIFFMYAQNFVSDPSRKPNALDDIRDIKLSFDKIILKS